MATTINIPSIDFANTPSTNQFCTVQYKVYTATSFTVWNDNVEFNTDGTPTVPLGITPVTSGQTYDVQMVSNCGSPGSVWTITLTVP